MCKDEAWDWNEEMEVTASSANCSKLMVVLVLIE